MKRQRSVRRLRIILILLNLAISIYSRAQRSSTLMGGRAAGLATASCSLGDEWSLINNVGGLARIDKPTGICAYEVKPSLPGANRLAAGIAVPFGVGTMGVSVFRFGDQVYNEQVASAALAHRAGNTSLGVRVSYVQFQTEGFGTQNALSLGLGGLYELTPKLIVGASITNLNQPKISSAENERLSPRLVCGVGFKPVDNVFLLIEAEKDLDYATTVKGGFEYLIYKKIFFRTGFIKNPNAGCFGLGFAHHSLKIDCGIRYSAVTRFTCQASVTYQWEKKKKNDKK